MPHSGNGKILGVGAEIRRQNHRMISQTVNKNNRKHTIRAAQYALYHTQFRFARPSVVDHFCGVFTLAVCTKLLNRILFPIHSNLSVQLEANHICLIESI